LHETLIFLQTLLFESLQLIYPTGDDPVAFSANSAHRSYYLLLLYVFCAALITCVCFTIASITSPAEDDDSVGLEYPPQTSIKLTVPFLGKRIV